LDFFHRPVFYRTENTTFRKLDLFPSSGEGGRRHSVPLERANLNHWTTPVKSYIATEGRSISKSWCRAPSRAHDQIFITVRQLRSCSCGTPSLTRGRVSLFYMLLALVSAVFLGPESLGSRDYILLSPFSDFPFRRLLRLAGSRWRSSSLPPHGCQRQSQSPSQSYIATDGRSISKSWCRASSGAHDQIFIIV
jgi:hypothetical protein